jgi:hypothetical protein
MNPIIVRMTRANINRDMVAHVQNAGFVDLHAEDLWLAIMKLIEARSIAPMLIADHRAQARLGLARFR